jgi:hypothetical protein
MKNLIGKIKGTDYKGLMVQHGEKIALCLAALVAVIVCARGYWFGYEKQPKELEDLAVKAKDTIEHSVFPEDEKNKFQPSTYYAKAEQMLGPLEGVGYGYGTAFTWSLRPRLERNKEPEHLTVEHLIGAYGKALLYSNAPLPELAAADEMAEEEGEPGDETSRRDTSTSRRGSGTAPPGAAGAASAMMATRAGRMSAPTSVSELGGEGPASAEEEKPSVEGRQFISVRGVFPLNKQAQRYMRALHTDTVSDATDMVQIVDFKIQRQKIVPGDKPFSGPWDDLDYNTALEVLDSAGNLDDDVVDSRVIDNTISMPLPERIVGYWTEALASHPDLKTFELSKDEMEEERKRNEMFMEQYGKMEGAEADDPRAKRGFASRMVDIRGIRNAVMANPEASRGMYGAAGGGRRPNSSMPGSSSMPMPAPVAIMPGGGGGHGGGAASAMMRSGAGPGAMRNAGQAIEEARLAAAGRLLLFRYLDFDVEPGEAYRYRVKLQFANPNFGLQLDEVEREDIAEGETRWGEWSEPCQAVVVEKEYDFYLTDVDRGRGRALPSAKLAMFQWLRDVGSYINTTAVQPLVVGVGSYVGGKGKSTLLEPAIPSMKKEQSVSFNSKDVLVDVAPAPQMLLADHPDLQLTGKRSTRPIAVVPDEAVVVDQFGQMLTLDDINGRKQEKKAEAMVDRERKEFDDLLEKADDNTNQLDRMTQMMASPDGGEKKKGKKAPSPLQRGSSAMPMPTVAPPGAVGAGSGSGSGRKPRRGGGS